MESRISAHLTVYLRPSTEARSGQALHSAANTKQRRKAGDGNRQSVKKPVYFHTTVHVGLDLDLSTIDCGKHFETRPREDYNIYVCNAGPAKYYSWSYCRFSQPDGSPLHVSWGTVPFLFSALFMTMFFTSASSERTRPLLYPKLLYIASLVLSLILIGRSLNRRLRYILFAC